MTIRDLEKARKERVNKIAEALKVALIDVDADYVYVIANSTDSGWHISAGRPRPEPQQFRDFLHQHQERLETLLQDNLLQIYWNERDGRATVVMLPLESEPFETITLPFVT